MNTIKSSRFSGCDTFSNSGYNRFDPAKPIRFYEPDNGVGDGKGGGNNADPNAGGGNSNPNNNSDNPADRQAAIADAVKTALGDLLGKNNGDKDATLTELIKRNHGLERQRDEAKAAALSKEDRAAFEAFKALNLSVDDVKRIVEEHGSWSEERAKEAQVGSLKKAAGAAKLNADLLASLDGARDAEYLTTGEGDKAVATVKYKDANGAEVVKPLGDWADEKWPHLKTALRTLGDSQEQPRTVKKFGKSAPAGSGQVTSVIDQIRERNQAETEKRGKGKTFIEKTREAGMTSR